MFQRELLACLIFAIVPKILVSSCNAIVNQKKGSLEMILKQFIFLSQSFSNIVLWENMDTLTKTLEITSLPKVKTKLIESSLN